MPAGAHLAPGTCILEVGGADSPWGSPGRGQTFPYGPSAGPSGSGPAARSGDQIHNAPLPALPPSVLLSSGTPLLGVLLGTLLSEGEPG